MSLEKDYKSGLKLFMKQEGYKTENDALKAIRKMLRKLKKNKKGLDF